MKKLVLIAFCVSMAIPGIAQDKPADREALIDSLIEQLGSQKWRQREQAQKELEKIGEPALGKLKEATKSDDPERSSRAEKIVGKIEKGLAERRVERLAKKAAEAHKPGQKVSDVEREVFRRIARIVVRLRASKDAPVVKQREVLEKEPDAKGAEVGKIGVAWGPQDATTAVNQLPCPRRFRTGPDTAGKSQACLSDTETCHQGGGPAVARVLCLRGYYAQADRNDAVSQLRA
jgi:hypothetical protein